MPTLEQELATIASSSPHYPVERWVEVGEVIGGVPVVMGVEHQIRCGCTDALGHDWGTKGHGDE